MQNRYVGDVGDFGNNGLLRWLCGMSETTAADGLGRLNLGVVWCLTHPTKKELKNQDGNLRKYLEGDSDEFSKCDSALYEALKPTLEDKEKRCISYMSDHFGKPDGILPDTVFYRKCLNPEEQNKIPKEKREKCLCTQPGYIKESRKEWLEGAVCKVADTRIVFVNPDNGIAPKNARGDKPKHIYMEELGKLFNEHKKSLVIYNHSNRSIPASEQIQRLSGRLESELRVPADYIRALWYHRGTARFHFIVAHPEDKCIKSIINSRLESFGKSLWCTIPRFTLVPRP